MTKIIVKNINNEKVWENYLLSHPEANFLQSWYWGEFHKNLGKNIQRTGFYKDSKLAGVILSVVEDAKRGRYLTVPGGPIIDWSPDLTDKFVSVVKQIAKENQCIFIRCRPQLKSDDSSKRLFKKLGFIGAPTHLHAELTSQLDIKKPEDQLLTDMRKTTRYEIKKAQSLKIKIIASSDPFDIKKFYNLQLLTSKRQNFVPFSFQFLSEQFKAFVATNKALLYKAYFDNKLLAQAFIIFYGNEAAYHYGASTDEGRKYPGAYLLLWEAIKEAKKRRMEKFNFWGVAPQDQPHHRFYGISVFKRGFGGEDFEYLHAQDLVIDYAQYLLNYLIERVRKYLRKL